MKVIDFAQHQKKSLLEQLHTAGTFFDVEKAPLIANYNEQEIIVPEKTAIINQDTLQILGIAGKNYHLVKNEEIFTSFDKAISQSNIDVTDAEAKVMFSNGGAKTMVEYKFPQHKINVGINDETILRIVARNSYDGSWSFSSQTGGYRLVCMNGQVMGVDISCYSNKHCSTLDVDIAAKKLTSAIDTFCEQGKMWNEWSKTKVTDDYVYANICLMFKKSDELKNGMFHQDAFKNKSIKTVWDMWKKDSSKLGKNKWAFYNAMTEWATHTKTKENSMAAAKTRREEAVKTVISSNMFKIAA